jgi:hypothetical protein
MGLFNLLGGGISFGTSARPGATALADSKYQNSILKYPIDLGAADKGHYILININEQTNTSFPAGNRTGDLPSGLANKKSIAKQFGGYDTSAGLANAFESGEAFKNAVMSTQIGKEVLTPIIDGAKGLESFLPKGVVGAGMDVIGAAASNIKANIGVRTTSRIADTIALYMPSNLKFEYNQGYTDLQSSGALGQYSLSLLNSAVDTYKSSGNIVDPKPMLNNLSPFLADPFNSAGPVGKILFTAGTGGKVQNPMLELLYTSPQFRTFQFDFLMFPRSEQEALEVQNIINKLRFHQAPELVKNSGGYFLYPPSEFDISFYYNGQENPNIPRISTCVLQNISTDYAPGGFAAYEVEGERFASPGRTGMPVGIRLSLSFKETEYLVKGSPLLGVDRRSSSEKGLADTIRDLQNQNIF